MSTNSKSSSNPSRAALFNKPPAVSHELHSSSNSAVMNALNSDMLLHGYNHSDLQDPNTNDIFLVKLTDELSFMGGGYKPNE